MKKLAFAPLFAAMFAALVALPAVPAAAQDVPDFVDVFAAAETTEIDGQVAGSYESKNELLVKIRNNDQFAVPMAAGADLSAFPKNALVKVSVTDGIVIDVRKNAGGAPGVTYETDSAWAELDGVPSDSLVRRVTLTSELEAVDHKEGKVTFIAPHGEVRTLTVEPASLLSELDIKSGELVDVTYFEAIGVSRR